jgi:poly(3-hydroxybutyrate) depolymerase
VGFLREMVGQVAAAHPVNTNRIYFSGHSNGCMMAQRMLAEASNLVAAVACFAGYLLAELSSTGYAPRPMMTIHGTADQTVPYVAGVLPHVPYVAGVLPHGPNPGAEENLAGWGGFNGCPGAASTETALGSYNLHELDCNGVVSKLVELPGVGHYPFAAPKENPRYNATIDGLGASFDTTQLAWDFVRAAFIAVPIACRRLSVCQPTRASGVNCSLHRLSSARRAASWLRIMCASVLSRPLRYRRGRAAPRAAPSSGAYSIGAEFRSLATLLAV